MIYEHKAQRLVEYLHQEVEHDKNFWAAFGLDAVHVLTVLESHPVQAKLLNLVAEQEFLGLSGHAVMRIAVGILLGAATIAPGSYPDQVPPPNTYSQN